MTTQPIDFEDVDKKLKDTRAHLTQLLDPADRVAEYDRELAPSRAALKFQPGVLAKEESAAQQALDKTRVAKAGEAAYSLQEIVKVLRPRLAASLAIVEAAPSPTIAWYQKTNRMATEDQQVNLAILHETRLARFDREWAAAGPAHVAAAYQAALRDPFDQLNASFIAWTEAKHGNGWRGRALTPEEAVDRTRGASVVTAVIDATRQARRPKAATDAIRLVDEADTLVERAVETRIGGVLVEKRFSGAWRELVA